MRHPLTRRLGATCVGIGLVAAATGGVAPATAGPSTDRAGTTSLAEVLDADGQKFDKNAADFDIVEAAALAVITAKPSSPVALITNGKQRLTVFVPTDAAFREFVKDLTGKAPKSEADVLAQVVKIAGSIDVVETILLYHVVAGKTLTSPKVLAAEGDKVTTAMGKSLRVHVTDDGVVLNDKDKDDDNPTVVALDINRGNKQVAHGIDRVLRPLDL